MIAGSWLLLAACSHPRITAPPETSTVRLRTAIVETNIALSCHGGAFCREDVVRPDASEAVSELTGDCARRGGRIERAACPRAGTVASCSGSTEMGPLVVYTYAQVDRDEQASAISTMSDLCEAMGGELALASDSKR